MSSCQDRPTGNQRSESLSAQESKKGTYCSERAGLGKTFGPRKLCFLRVWSLVTTTERRGPRVLEPRLPRREAPWKRRVDTTSALLKQTMLPFPLSPVASISTNPLPNSTQRKKKKRAPKRKEKRSKARRSPAEAAPAPAGVARTRLTARYSSGEELPARSSANGGVKSPTTTVRQESPVLATPDNIFHSYNSTHEVTLIQGVHVTPRSAPARGIFCLFFLSVRFPPLFYFLSHFFLPLAFVGCFGFGVFFFSFGVFFNSPSLQITWLI